MEVTMVKQPKQLKVNFSDLRDAMEDNGELINYYLDNETGEVIPITEEISAQLELFYEAYYDEETKAIDWDTAFETENTPDWEREMLQEADKVEAQYSERYLRIPPADSGEGYQDMVDFIAELKNKSLKQQLDAAIRGRGAFRRFKDVLGDFPGERLNWFTFKEKRLSERAMAWLESKDIQLILESGDAGSQ